MTQRLRKKEEEGGGEGDRRRRESGGKGLQVKKTSRGEEREVVANAAVGLTRPSGGAGFP